MIQLKAALVGAGNRGQVYSDYALERPQELKIVSVVDVNRLRKREVAEKYGIMPEYAFDNLDDFLQKKVQVDFVIDATMDEMHYETAMKLIDAGYNLILEKPITPTPEELMDIKRNAERKGVKILVCHVLRYTPFYRTVKSIITRGEIGDIISMEMNEHVGIAHFIDSYVRGKWNSEKKCGSGFLLAKCCHDTDLMCWLNNQTSPEKVSSFGSRALFIPENAPKNATAFCLDCPHVDSCIYSAKKIHLELDSMPFQTWAALNKPLDKITREEKEAYLRTSTYGKCAYNSGGDIVDRQSVSVQFKNGSIATLNMIGGASEAGRWLHVVGTKGEIVGYIETAKIKVVRFVYTDGKFGATEEEIDVSSQIVANAMYSGHAGGDFGLMYDAVRYFAGEGQTDSVTMLSDSVNGHLIVYAAEKSRKEGTIVFLKEYENV